MTIEIPTEISALWIVVFILLVICLVYSFAEGFAALIQSFVAGSSAVILAGYLIFR